MAIDIRATVTCSLGTLISGSISDDYLQGSGLVKTRGSIELSALITPNIGTAVTFSYVKGGVTRTIPRKLRVMSSFADPFRRTTKVELGCKLTYLSDLRESLKWNAFDDPENEDFDEEDDKIITIPISAASVMSQCLSKLGLSASTIPLTNFFSIAEFDFGAGYIQVLSDLLISESYFGYLDTNEVLQVRSLSDGGGTGPVFTSTDIVELGPIGIGQLPGEAVTVSYSTLKLKKPPEEDEDKEKELNWEREEIIGPETTVTTQYTIPASSEVKRYQTWVYIPRTVSETTYDDWDRVVKRVSTSYTIGAAIITQYYVDSWTASENTIGAQIGFYEASEQTIVDTEIMEYVLPAKGERPEIGYEDVVSITRTKEEPQMAIAGSIAASFLEDDGSLVNYMPLYGNTITEKSITTFDTQSAAINEVVTPITKSIVEKYKAYGYTQSGQQETAKQTEAGTTTATAIFNAMNLVPDGIEVTINSGRGVGLQERPPSADRTNAELADGGDPNNGYRVESSGELELAVGSATAQRRIELSLPYAPDDRFTKTGSGEDIVYLSVPSDAPQKAQNFGRVQNRLLLGNRNGINLQVAPDRLPAAPFEPLYVQASGLTALYRANGTSWAFDSNGIVASVDALFWAAVGGTGTFWFPVAPGITTLPTTPAIVDTSPTEVIGSVETVGATPQTTLNTAFPSAVSGDGVQDETTGDFWVYNGSTWNDVGTAPGPTTTATAVVLPYNETAIYVGRLRLGTVVTKFEYSLELLTVVPAITLSVGPVVERILSIEAPSVNITITADVPVVTSSVDVRVSAIDTLIEAPVPLVGTGIGNSVAASSISITIAAGIPFAGSYIVRVPAADIVVTALLPQVGGQIGSAAQPPAAAITVQAELPTLA